jgi:hypothetical protein
MQMIRIVAVAATAAGIASCAGGTRSAADPPQPEFVPGGTLAQVYYWRAKSGKLDEYSKYIRELAEPIDHEAQRRGAFLTVTTYVAHDTASAWTHMRVFILRDSAQLKGLSVALDSAGIRLEPDSTKRRVRSAYSATLRDRVGAVTVEVLR